MSQASCSSRDLPVVLDQPHLGGDAGELGVAALVGGDQPVDLGRQRRGARGSCRPDRAPGSSSMWRTGRPSEDDISCSDGRRPAHSSPYCRSRKNSSVSRAERGRA